MKVTTEEFIEIAGELLHNSKVFTSIKLIGKTTSVVITKPDKIEINEEAWDNSKNVQS